MSEWLTDSSSQFVISSSVKNEKEIQNLCSIKKWMMLEINDKNVLKIFPKNSVPTCRF